MGRPGAEPVFVGAGGEGHRLAIPLLQIVAAVGVVGVDKEHDRAVFDEDAFEKQEWFDHQQHAELPLLAPDPRIVVGKTVEIWGRGHHPVEPQPLAGKVVSQSPAAGISEHPLHLLIENVVLQQRAVAGNGEQCLVGEAAPEEKRQPRRQFVAVEQRSGVGCRRLGKVDEAGGGEDRSHRILHGLGKRPRFRKVVQEGLMVAIENLVIDPAAERDFEEPGQPLAGRGFGRRGWRLARGRRGWSGEQRLPRTAIAVELRTPHDIRPQREQTFQQHRRHPQFAPPVVEAPLCLEIDRKRGHAGEDLILEVLLSQRTVSDGEFIGKSSARRIEIGAVDTDRFFGKRIDVAAQVEQIADGVVVFVAIEPPHHDRHARSVVAEALPKVCIERRYKTAAECVAGRGFVFRGHLPVRDPVADLLENSGGGWRRMTLTEAGEIEIPFDRIAAVAADAKLFARGGEFVTGKWHSRTLRIAGDGRLPGRGIVLPSGRLTRAAAAHRVVIEAVGWRGRGRAAQEDRDRRNDSSPSAHGGPTPPLPLHPRSSSFPAGSA